MHASCIHHAVAPIFSKSACEVRNLPIFSLSASGVAMHFQQTPRRQPPSVPSSRRRRQTTPPFSSRTLFLHTAQRQFLGSHFPVVFSLACGGPFSRSIVTGLGVSGLSIFSLLTSAASFFFFLAGFASISFSAGTSACHDLPRFCHICCNFFASSSAVGATTTGAVAAATPSAACAAAMLSSFCSSCVSASSCLPACSCSFAPPASLGGAPGAFGSVAIEEKFEGRTFSSSGGGLTCAT
mmetsp:Transcript_43309/g.92709  ORF Transcript_43309/g.92709 Transcript_43309/m.92709 type:complete len:239 (-) Transcript_43309:398-1114(-)